MRLRNLVLPLVAAAAGCSPPISLQYYQPLRPTPSRECIATALAKSPAVASADSAKVDGDFLPFALPGFFVFLTDTTARAKALDVAVNRESRPDSAADVIVRYRYVDYAAPTAAERIHWEASARDILAGVRAACWPSATVDTVACRRVGVFGKKRSCAAPNVDG